MSPKRHLCFLHSAYPAQFGPIMGFLKAHYEGLDFTFISESTSKPLMPGLRHVTIRPEPQGENPYFFSRYFDEECRRAHASLVAVEKVFADNPPDRFIGHTAFGVLNLLYAAYPEIPKIGFFEYFYNPYEPEVHHRPEFPVPKANLVRIPLRNATQLIALEYCTKGYSPTAFQRSTYPAAYQDKLTTLFDGVDTEFYCPGEIKPDSELPRSWPKDVKIVTYVSRGLESFRGFDLFMDMAYQICQVRDDVHFVIAGNPQTHYGPDQMHLKPGETFKEYVLKQKPYDLSRFHFLNWISESALRDLFRLSDAHVYWTLPFTLSWSFFQAMATGVAMVASDTAPVRDVLIPGENGWAVNSHNLQGFVDTLLEVLDAPANDRAQRQDAARQTIVERFSFPVCLPKLAEFYLSAD
jgi:glycosyltransferase involved in cell wall biosynthesis